MLCVSSKLSSRRTIESWALSDHIWFCGYQQKCYTVYLYNFRCSSSWCDSMGTNSPSVSVLMIEAWVLGVIPWVRILLQPLCWWQKRGFSSRVAGLIVMDKNGKHICLIVSPINSSLHTVILIFFIRLDFTQTTQVRAPWF